jgi:lipooligosaccharide transport system permease protein
MTLPAVTVLEAHFTRFRPRWKGNLLMTLVQPVLLVLAFGVVVGRYVGDIDGMPYIDYVVPGMIAAGALQMAILDGTYPVRGNMYWLKLYDVQAAAPLRVADILGGHIGFLTAKVAVSSAVFLIVGGVAGVLHSAWAIVVVPVAVLVALAGALPTFAFSVAVGNPTYLELIIRCGLLPMTLFAGVFYPVESLPVGVRLFAYVSPLWHGVELCRGASYGALPFWPAAGHVAALLLWAAAGWWFAARAFGTRLSR